MNPLSLESKNLINTCYKAHISCQNADCMAKPKEGEKFKICSRECQKKDWPQHKKSCAAPPSKSEYKQLNVVVELIGQNCYKDITKLAEKMSKQYNISLNNLCLSLDLKWVDHPLSDPVGFFEKFNASPNKFDTAVPIHTDKFKDSSRWKAAFENDSQGFVFGMIAGNSSITVPFPGKKLK